MFNDKNQTQCMGLTNIKIFYSHYPMNANQQQPQPLKMCPFILAPGVCTTLSHDLICHIYHFFGNK